MGIEYRLTFSHESRAAVHAVLLRLPDAMLEPTSQRTVNFHTPPASSRMPDATATAEDYGIYFCDNGGHGRMYLGQVVAKLVSEFGSVVVSEFE